MKCVFLILSLLLAGPLFAQNEEPDEVTASGLAAAEAMEEPGSEFALPNGTAGVELKFPDESDGGTLPEGANEWDGTASIDAEIDVEWSDQSDLAQDENVEELELPADSGRDPVAPDPANGEELISLEFAEAEVRQVLQIVAELCGFHVEVPAGLDATVAVSLQSVTWREVFDEVLEPLGYRYRVEGGTVLVEKATALGPRSYEAQVATPGIRLVPSWLVWVLGFYLAGGLMLNFALAWAIAFAMPDRELRVLERPLWVLAVLFSGVIGVFVFYFVNHDARPLERREGRLVV